jgi:hypothetical protein
MIFKATRDLRKSAIGLSLLIALTGLSVLGQTQPSQPQAAACPPGQDCPCTWTSWLNRDQVGGKGDYETLAEFIKSNQVPCKRPTAVQCRYRGTVPPGGTMWGSQVLPNGPVNSAGPGYTCSVAVGGVCVNSKTVSCKDSEVRFCCAK